MPARARPVSLKCPLGEDLPLLLPAAAWVPCARHPCPGMWLQQPPPATRPGRLHLRGGDPAPDAHRQDAQGLRRFAESQPSPHQGPGGPSRRTELAAHKQTRDAHAAAATASEQPLPPGGVPGSSAAAGPRPAAALARAASACALSTPAALGRPCGNSATSASQPEAAASRAHAHGVPTVSSQVLVRGAPAATQAPDTRGFPRGRARGIWAGRAASRGLQGHWAVAAARETEGLLASRPHSKRAACPSPGPSTCYGHAAPAALQTGPHAGTVSPAAPPSPCGEAPGAALPAAPRLGCDTRHLRDF